MEKETGKAIHYYRIFYAVIGWSALVLSYIFVLNGVYNSYGPFQGMFSILKLFTMQTNLIVLLWATMAVRNKMFGEKNPLDNPKARGAIVVYISVTGLMFLTLLRVDYSGDGIGYLIHIISHYFIPLAYMLDWLITEKRGTYSWGYIKYWMIYPLLYGGAYLAYGLISDNYLYSFMDIATIGYPTFFRNITLLVALFLALSAIVILINRFLAKKLKNLESDRVDI